MQRYWLKLVVCFDFSGVYFYQFIGWKFRAQIKWLPLLHMLAFDAFLSYRIAVETYCGRQVGLYLGLNHLSSLKHNVIFQFLSFKKSVLWSLKSLKSLLYNPSKNLLGTTKELFKTQRPENITS